MQSVAQGFGLSSAKDSLELFSIWHYHGNMTDPIAQLQEIITHQQEDIAQLNDEVYAQQKQISALHVQMHHMIEKLKRLEEGRDNVSAAGEEPPPPHY